MAATKNIKRTAIVDAIVAKPQTAKELAEAFGIVVDGMRRHLDVLSLHGQIRAVGRRGKKEIVWGAPQVSIGGVDGGRHLPMLVPGEGDRDHTCQRNETSECIDAFDRAYPNHDGPARCPVGCTHRVAIPRSYWREYATEGRGVSQAGMCEAVGEVERVRRPIKTADRPRRVGA